MDTIQRASQQRVVDRMKPQKVMLIFGPRRVGKTFLLKQIVQSFKGKSLMLNGEEITDLAYDMNCDGVVNVTDVMLYVSYADSYTLNIYSGASTTKHCQLSPCVGRYGSVGH